MRTETITAGTLTDFGADVHRGLTRHPQKELPSKYLYDALGSALFEAICLLPEYGVTRADERLLRRHAHNIVRRLSLPTLVAELGSGSGKKTRWILEALGRRQATSYHPIEISRAALDMCERELGDIDSISIVGFEREYLDGLLEVAARRGPEEHILVLFLGSTIGNFETPSDRQFLAQVRRILQPGDGLLLGTDLLKPIPQLIDAYDDPLGVTAAFNLNLLARINRELGGDFDLRGFRHEARFNAGTRSIEMHLCSLDKQVVNIPGANLSVTFVADETIWTENCHKYSLGELETIAHATGFNCDAQWIDDEWPFAESLLVAA